MKAKALASTLSKKHADGEVIFVSEMNFDAPKAAEAKTAFGAIAKGSSHEDMASKRKNAALIVLSGRDQNAEKSFRNFGNVAVKPVKDVNPVDLLTYKYVVVSNPEESLKTLETRVAAKAARITTEDKK